MRKSRKLSLIVGAVVVLAIAGVWGITSLNGATADVDPSRVVTVERGTMVKSVVATGKIEPITKVEIKSKANGIIEHLNVDVDQIVRAGDVLAELDKEQLARTSASSRRASRPRRPPERGRGATREEPDRSRIPGRRARQAQFRARPRSSRSSCLPQSGLDDAKSALDVAQTVSGPRRAS